MSKSGYVIKDFLSFESEIESYMNQISKLGSKLSVINSIHPDTNNSQLITLARIKILKILEHAIFMVTFLNEKLAGKEIEEKLYEMKLEEYEKQQQYFHEADVEHHLNEIHYLELLERQLEVFMHHINEHKNIIKDTFMLLVRQYKVIFELQNQKKAIRKEFEMTLNHLFNIYKLDKGSYNFSVDGEKYQISHKEIYEAFQEHFSKVNFDNDFSLSTVNDEKKIAIRQLIVDRTAMNGKVSNLELEIRVEDLHAHVSKLEDNNFEQADPFINKLESLAHDNSKISKAMYEEVALTESVLQSVSDTRIDFVAILDSFQEQLEQAVDHVLQGAEANLDLNIDLTEDLNIDLPIQMNDIIDEIKEISPRSKPKKKISFDDDDDDMAPPAPPQKSIADSYLKVSNPIISPCGFRSFISSSAASKIKEPPDLSIRGKNDAKIVSEPGEPDEPGESIRFRR